jgi:hypothetical protein
VSNVGGVNIPDPGFYSSGRLPWGLDPATSPIADALKTPVAPNAKQIQAEYHTLNQQDTAELLYASFLSPAASLANTDAVLEQAARLQNEQLAAQQQAELAKAGADLPSVSNIIADSNAAAQSALSNYAKAPAGSSILDYQA